MGRRKAAETRPRAQADRPRVVAGGLLRGGNKEQRGRKGQRAGDPHMAWRRRAASKGKP